MGKVNQLAQDARQERWQQHYDNYCIDEFGGRQPEGREHDQAVQFANDMMEEEDADCN